MPHDLCRKLEPRAGAVHKPADARASQPSGHQAVVEKLRRARAFVDAAAELAGVGAWELDIVRGKVWWSKHMYVIFGLDPAVFHPTFEAVMDRVHPEDREVVSHRLQTVLTKHAALTLDNRIIGPAGAIIDVRSYVALELDERGDPVRLWGVAQTVTDRALAREK